MSGVTARRDSPSYCWPKSNLTCGASQDSRSGKQIETSTFLTSGSSASDPIDPSYHCMQQERTPKSFNYRLLALVKSWTRRGKCNVQTAKHGKNELVTVWTLKK